MKSRCWKMRSRHWLVSLSLMACTGCAAVQDLQQWSTNSARARWSWWTDPSTLGTGWIYSDFATGYRAGWYSVAMGGDGRPPAVPPREYWAPWYQSARGAEAIQSWYKGFSTGAIAAESAGVNHYTLVPSQGLTPPPTEGFVRQEWSESVLQRPPVTPGKGREVIMSPPPESLIPPIPSAAPPAPPIDKPPMSPATIQPATTAPNAPLDALEPMSETLDAQARALRSQSGSVKRSLVAISEGENFTRVDGQLVASQYLANGIQPLPPLTEVDLLAPNGTPLRVTVPSVTTTPSAVATVISPQNSTPPANAATPLPIAVATFSEPHDDRPLVPPAPAAQSAPLPIARQATRYELRQDEVLR